MTTISIQDSFIQELSYLDLLQANGGETRLSESGPPFAPVVGSSNVPTNFNISTQSIGGAQYDSSDLLKIINAPTPDYTEFGGFEALGAQDSSENIRLMVV
jgi:hypothetical protein